MKNNISKSSKSKNVGNLDSILRVILGSSILVAGLYMDNFWGLLGFIPLFTGAVGWCPIYKLFGIRTCKTDIELNV